MYLAYSPLSVAQRLASVFPTISVQVALSWVHGERVPSCLPQVDHFIPKYGTKPLGARGRDGAGEVHRNGRNRHVGLCPPDKCGKPNVDLTLDVRPGEGPRWRLPM